MKYFCCTERRRNAVKRHPSLNGIDYLEVVDNEAAPFPERQTTLLLHFLKPLIASNLGTDNIWIKGGERIRDIDVVELKPIYPDSPAIEDTNVFVVKVAAAGDFSTYTLYLVKDRRQKENMDAPTGFDPVLSKIDFSFKVNCPSDLDCETTHACPPEPDAAPFINYLAKDYASFRRLMLDRMALLTPGWTERNPADMGVMLVELLAYAADYLSYRQDAIATEAYLGTARKRISVRRHARLVDYLMHDGCNSRAWVQIKVSAENGIILRKGEGRNAAKILTKVDGLSFPAFTLDSTEYKKAIKGGAKVFELMHDVKLYEQHNTMYFYTWGEQDCCLPKGASEATLLGNFSNLKRGDVLIFAEMLDPETGESPDADPGRRHAVRLTEVACDEDINLAYYLDPSDCSSEESTLSVTHIKWDKADATPFPFCISQNGIENISAVLGNIALVDHGLTIRDQEESSLQPNTAPAAKLVYPKQLGAENKYCEPELKQELPPRFRPKLTQSPLTFAAPVKMEEIEDEYGKVIFTKPAMFDSGEKYQSAASLMQWSEREALPVLCLWEEGGKETKWIVRRDLLIDSSATDKHFVLEMETDGTAFIRFGNNINGARPEQGAKFLAEYRVGNGAGGNVGALTLSHLATNDVSLINSIPGGRAIWNPLPAQGGKEGETIQEVKQYAPQAFRTQERAVTPKDYEVFAKKRRPDVQRAAATFRWTGSWKTAFVTADRFGGLEVDTKFEKELRKCLERYRMAGFDLEVDAPIYVPLEVEMVICVHINYLAGDVKEALLEAFSNRLLPNGRRGVFHPDNFTFGQAVYLSRLYTAAQNVEGVDSVQITKFRRQEDPFIDGIEDGKLEFGRREIARLDNDPNFPDRGMFNLIVKGGR